MQTTKLVFEDIDEEKKFTDLRREVEDKEQKATELQKEVASLRQRGVFGPELIKREKKYEAKLEELEEARRTFATFSKQFEVDLLDSRNRELDAFQKRQEEAARERWFEERIEFLARFLTGKLRKLAIEKRNERVQALETYIDRLTADV